MIGAIIGIITLLVMVYALFFMPAPKINLDRKTSPDITTANEGAIVPILFGKAKFSGNIIGYANFVSKKRKKKGQTIGYDYYLDVWQAICYGKIVVENIYVKDKDEDPVSTSITFNDGTSSYYPTELGEYANALPGIATYFFKRMHLGLESTFVPSIDYVARRVIPGTVPIVYPILTNGFNPAFIVYLILIDKGVPVSKINIPAFNVAATYWNSVDYGLNILIKTQNKTKEHIKKVLSYVDGVFGQDNEGKYFIKAFDPTEASVATISSATDDFMAFEFQRKTWDDTFNEFRGAFTDESQQFSERQLIVRNRANINLQGTKKVMNVDLDAFINATDASKRLWEIAKRESYPYAHCSFKTNLEYSFVLKGDIVTIVNPEEGIVSADFRITEKQHFSNDKNELAFKSVQVTETLFDDAFIIAGQSQYVAVTYTPSVLVKQRIFELPFNSIYKHSPAYLCLAARVNTFENGFDVYFSNDNITYELYDSFSDWSMNGILSATYSATTDYIDDTGVISFTPYKDDPEFLSVSRAALFTANRYALIDNEIVKFQNIQLLSGKYYLTGIVRGCFHTTIATHNSGVEIWIFTIEDNILTELTDSNFYIKLLPTFLEKVVEISSATAINVVSTAKAMIPFKPCRIKAVRVGSSITVSWIPVNQDTDGAGALSADIQTDLSPSPYDQDFDIYHTYATTPVIVVGLSTVITYASQTTVYLRSRRSGFASSYISVLVPAADGTYIGPSI